MRDKVVFEFKVTIDQDPVPGAFHEIEDTKRRLQNMLTHAFVWYNPEVEIIKTAMVERNQPRNPA